MKRVAINDEVTLFYCFLQYIIDFHRGYFLSIGDFFSYTNLINKNIGHITFVIKITKGNMKKKKNNADIEKIILELELLDDEKNILKKKLKFDTISSGGALKENMSIQRKELEL